MPRSLRLSLLAALVCPLALAAAAPQVAVIEDAPWSPGDAPREGAGEMAVLLQLATLRRAHELVGFVGVGDERGKFQFGTQRGLEFAVQQGVPVVRLARAAGTRADDGDEFIPGGNLTAAAAQLLLAQCLTRFGPLPVETGARRAKLAQYRAAFQAGQPELFARN